MKQTVKHIICKLPVSLIEKLRVSLEISPPTCDVKLHLDYFIYFLSKVATIPITNNKFKNLRKVPVSSVILLNEMGKNYKRYIEYLILHKFIQCDNHYIVGDKVVSGKCKCYSITNRIKMINYVDYKISNKFLLSKILLWRKQRFGSDSNDPLVSKIYNMIGKFHIDIESADAHLEALVENKAISRRSKQLEIDKCMRINNKDSNTLEHFVIKDTYNRIHSNFTNLSKIIRENFLYIGDKKVISIDVQTCQPALLYSLYANYYNQAKQTLDNPFIVEEHFLRKDVRAKYVNKENSFDGESCYGHQVNFEFSTFGYSLSEFVSKLKIELGCYERALYNDIYDFFSEQWFMFYDDSKNRNEIKKEWVSYVFGNKTNNNTIRIEKIWEFNFPLMTKLMKHFKKDDYRTLAHSLQRSESAIMYDNLFPQLESKFNCFTTVHDCILVSEDDVDEAASIFQNVLINNSIKTGISISI